MDCIHTAEDIVKLHSSFFSIPYADNQFQGKPRQQVREIHGGGEILQFSTEIAVYLGNGAK